MMPLDFRRTRLAATCAALAVAIMALGWLVGWGGLPDIFGDARFALARRAASGQVVLVDIDEKSIAAIGVWPWPRTVHAEIVDRLNASGASDIAFDVDFSSRSSEVADASFEAALQRAEGKVILAAERQRLSAAAPELSLVVPLPRFSGNAWLALADVMVDYDGLIRTIPAGIRQGDETIPSLAAALSGAKTGNGPNFRIDYGIDASGIDHISVADLLAGKIDGARIAGRKIIVGATSVALRDFFNVPRFGVIQGSLVHALAAESLLQSRALARENASARLIASAMLILAVVLILQFAPTLPGLALTAGLALALEALAIGIQRALPLSLETAEWHMVLFGTLIAIVFREIWERGALWKIARDERRATQAILDRVFEDNFSAIMVVDGASRIRAASSEALRHFGLGPLAAILGNRAQTLLPPALNALFAVGDSRGSAPDTGLIELETAAHGRRTYEYTRSASIFSDKLASDPARLAICVTLQDVTERRQTEKRIAALARTDGLTQLPNRNSFMEVMAARAAIADIDLHLIDLDGFKAINDAMGQDWGDGALQYFAGKIAEAAGPAGFAARTDGDEFAVLLPAGLSEAFAKSILALLDEAIDISGRRAVLGASIGIAALDAGAGLQGTVRRAALAMSEAKLAGGRTVRRYLPGTEAKMAASDALERELQIALERGEFRSYYQPQVNLASMAVVGAESLIRWQHPERGLVSPGEFIPLLEKGRLIVPVGAWILRQACQDAVTWPGDVHISVNVAVTQLIAGDFASVVAEILAQTGLDPARLDLELTESLFIQDANVVAKVLKELRALGVGLALDDFGTGYSSLAYIKRYPFTKVKLDRAFVRDLPESRESVAITQAVTAIASALDLKVVAEGVETPEQLSAVRLLGCDEVQGFFTGRPMPAAAFAQCLAKSGPVSLIQ